MTGREKDIPRFSRPWGYGTRKGKKNRHGRNGGGSVKNRSPNKKMKKQFPVIIIFLSLFFFPGPLHPEQQKNRMKNFLLVAELGGGHWAYAGMGYDLARLSPSFRSFAYLKETGALFGFTYLSDDKVTVYEPCLFITGEILNHKIEFKPGSGLDIDWRVKAGRITVSQGEYGIRESAFTISLDILLRTFRYFYIDISLPLVSAEEGAEIAPCIGAGMVYRIF